MGDKRRFDEFAKLISGLIPKNAVIADVASGKGYLQAALRQLGYSDVTSWDKRRKNASNRRGYRYGLFQWDKAPKYDAIVAMHPDEGTDHAILYAAKHGVPAIICPCCIKPSAEVYWGRHAFADWAAHLEGLALRLNCRVRWADLPISGRNRVLIVNGYHRAKADAPPVR